MAGSVPLRQTIATGAAGEIFLSLDGLRGVAALVVAVRHMPHLFGDLSLPNAHLAVDFFFLLSGVVIAHAYQQKFAAGLSWARFMRIRLIRLYPAALLGLLLGVAVALAALCFPGSGLIVHWTPRLLELAVLTGSVLLPTPPIDGNSLLYPLNPVMWSVLAEILVNALFFILHKVIPGWMFAGLTLLFGLCFVALALPLVSIDQGFSWDFFSFGLLRALYPFCLGTLIYRLQFRRRVTSDALTMLLGLLLATALLAPWHGLGGELLASLIVFPLLIALGVMVRPYRLVALCRGLGAASYMLYALHKPAYQLFYGLITVLWPQSSATLSPLIGALFLGLLLLVCLGLTRRYERTIRDWLSRR